MVNINVIERYSLIKMQSYIFMTRNKLHHTKNIWNSNIAPSAISKRNNKYWSKITHNFSRYLINSTNKARFIELL